MRIRNFLIGIFLVLFVGCISTRTIYVDGDVNFEKLRQKTSQNNEKIVEYVYDNKTKIYTVVIRGKNKNERRKF